MLSRESLWVIILFALFMLGNWNTTTRTQQEEIVIPERLPLVSQEEGQGGDDFFDTVSADVDPSFSGPEGGPVTRVISSPCLNLASDIERQNCENQRTVFSVNNYDDYYIAIRLEDNGGRDLLGTAGYPFININPRVTDQTVTQNIQCSIS
jgi:hypothetical protein